MPGALGPLALAAATLSLVSRAHAGAAGRWEDIEKVDAEWKKRQFASLRAELPFRISKECSPARGNSSLAMVRCIVAKSVDPDASWDEEKQTNLTWDAINYITDIQAEAAEYAKSDAATYGGPSSPMTAQWPEDHSRMLIRPGAYPRVYFVDAWDKECDDPSLGYWYSLEVWVRTFFQETRNLALVDSADAADYVYISYCIRRKMFLASQAEENSNTQVKYLLYEGNLVEKAVRAVDEQYMLATFKRLQATQDVKQCLERPSCRFLIASIDGRHVYRKFFEFLGDKALAITHMGMSDWVSREPGNLYWTDLHHVSMVGGLAPIQPGCRASCPLHCQLEPPASLPDDIVVPWTVGYGWTRRSGQFCTRDVLAFFSGSNSSCSRGGHLFNALHRDFVSAVRARGSTRSRKGFANSILVFPPHVKLEQREWSEIAYRSKICLVPDGDCAMTGRLIEVIMHGCVPMIITNRLLPPYHEYIEWRRIAFFVREDEIPALPGILAWIQREPQALEAKQQRLREASRFFDYTLEAPAMLLVALSRRAQSRRRPTPDGWGA
eukprot:CAMPEP_0180706404 /NCGR_PEP_ID=MMETSP1038_2-20121128/8182_1 /TAXON_ID=632150 /ORGANISM="Azadinium spinosum, Strain 3D9" /LENGTH=551 /DNA_ID=CAMNT_0022738323 /DNA_START=9 /DNA_END=1664 /DNA_ORIENTATION=-